MAKHILKYKNHGKDIPWFISEPGLFIINSWYYGISKEDTDCYIPSDIAKIPLAQLEALVLTQDMYRKKETASHEEEALTNAEKKAYVAEAMKGIVVE